MPPLAYERTAEGGDILPNEYVSVTESASDAESATDPDYVRTPKKRKRPAVRRRQQPLVSSRMGAVGNRYTWGT